MSETTPTYATENDVYKASGFTKAALLRILDIESQEMTEQILNYIVEAEGKVKEAVSFPAIKAFEQHFATGEDDEFQLGQEDETFYTGIDVEDCIESVKMCLFEGTKRKLPYPRDCDEPTEDYTLWDDTGYTPPTNEQTIKEAGDVSMKFNWSSVIGIARYPNVTDGYYIDKNIDIFDYMFMRLRSNTASVTVTIKLYDAAGNYNEATFLISKANHWYKAMLDLDQDFTSTVDWDDNPLYYFTVTVDKACILYVDNLNFNDEWCFTAPSGQLVIMRRSVDEPAPDGYEFTVTYTYDPFKVTVPELIKSATKKFAAAKLIEHLIGIREAYITYEAESLSLIPEKDQLYATKGSLEAGAKQDLRDYGYGWAGAPILG